MWQLTAGAVLVAAVLGFFSGKRWEEGAQALALEKQKAQLEEQLREQKAEADKKGMDHAVLVSSLNDKLVEVTSQRDKLTTGARCLSGRAVGVLNSIGRVPDVGTAAGQPASASAAAAGRQDEPAAYASDRDLYDAVAICRTRYDEVSDQLNKILDIEDARVLDARSVGK